jgi:hypothetical protein
MKHNPTGEACHDCGAALHHGEKTFRCTHETCERELLCEGCVWPCADCSEDFCERHITDATPDSLTEQTFVCGACLRKRRDPLEQAKPRNGRKAA